MEIMKSNEIRILAVDDELGMLDLIRVLFKKFNFSIETAHSGNQALELLDKQEFDLVLTDVRMPDGDGIELAQKIRNKHPAKPSILFMTGFSDLLNEEIFHIGAEGKFTKPFDNNAVRAAIETCMLLPYLRWNKAPIRDNYRLNIQHTGKSVQLWDDEKIVQFGRGGFFASYSKSLPEKNTVISFELMLEQPVPIIFSGSGIVRWTHPRSKNVAAGVGVEITYMPEAESKKYYELFRDVRPFIPSPYR